MNYLKYIEHSAENLQFYLWYRDYSERWERLQNSDKALAPVWTTTLAESEMNASSPMRPKKMPAQITEMLKNTDFEDRPKANTDRIDPFNTPPKADSFDEKDEKRDFASDYGSSMGDDKTLLSSTASGHRTVADQAFDDAGMKWKPCMPPPIHVLLTTC